MRIAMTVNGRPVELDVLPFKRLLDVLREDLGLTGTKEGCGEGECGACTTLVDGEPLCACLVPVARCDGGEVVTVEGVMGAGGQGDMHPLQASMSRLGASQCGICIPGMVVMGAHFVDAARREGRIPTEAEVRTAIAGNICRCTGYVKIVDAVLDAVRGGEA